MDKVICEIDTLITEARRTVARTHTSILLLDEIIDFDSYMQDIRDVAEIANNENIQLKNRNIGKRKAGRRIQDLMDLNFIKQENLDFSHCANCKHQFVLPFSQSQIEINHHNDNLKEEYRKAMYDWNHRSKSRKITTKSKVGQPLSIKLACLCTMMYCLNRPDGVGSLKCEWVCIEQKKLNKESRSYFDTNEDCQCHICNCQCMMVYYCHEENKLAVQTKENFMASIDTKPLQKIIGFFGFANTIADLTKKRLKKSKGMSSCIATIGG